MKTEMPFYKFVTMFMTGLIFTGCCIFLYSDYIPNLVESDLFKSINLINTGLTVIITVSLFSVVYEIGYIINRIGFLMGNILKAIKAIPFNKDYKKFNEKEKEFPTINILAREYSLTRTSMTLFLVMTVVACFYLKWIFAIVMFLLSVLFFFSMRGHAKKIVKLMED
ncbi:hypothetical protein FACS189452_08460 [Bacteroidia bacterium]|nr:hypothetical protein FACS189452_08460 [Bacteroidia bacterium]